MKKIILLALICCPPGAAWETGPDFFSCVRELKLPQYPPLARQARIHGHVHAVILLDAAGEPDVGFGDGGHPLFKQTLEPLLRQARYSESCKSQTISVVFTFKFNDEAKPVQGDRGTVILMPPGRIVIEVRHWPSAFHPTTRVPRKR